jgi:hypothetical protein
MLEDYGITPMKDMALAMLDGVPKYNVVVYESYKIKASHARAHIGSTVPTLQAIGQIKLAVWKAQRFGAHAVQLIEQEPRDKSTGRAAARGNHPGLSVLIEQALELDAAGKHDEAHHGDAIMHLVAYFHKHYGEKGA